MDRFIVPGALPALGAIFFLGGIVGAAVVGAFKLYFWSEARVARVVDLAFTSDAFQRAVEKIAAAAFTARAEADNAFRTQLSADVREMKSRADAQSRSIVEAHRRIDTLLEKLFGAVAGRAQEVAAVLGLVEEPKR